MKGLLAAALLCAAPALAVDGPGTAVAPILRLGPGARPAALGEAYVAIADGADASAWNPAALAFLQGPEATLMYLRLHEQLHYNYLAFGMPWRERFGFGSHLVYARTDDIPRTFEDPGGNFDPRRSGGNFVNTDMKLNLSAAYKVLPWLSAGGGASFFRDTVDDDSANGFLFDVGALARPPGFFTYGLAVQNLGPSKGGEAPAQARAGASATFGPALASLELLRPFDSGKLIPALGAEYRAMPMLALRAGYRLGPSGDAGGRRWSVGLGVRYARASFDFAVVPFGELGVSQRVSLSYAFGGAVEPSRASEPRPSSRPEPEAAEEKEEDPAALLAEADRLILKKRYEKAGSVLLHASESLEKDDERQVVAFERIGLVSLRLNRLRPAREAYMRALRHAKELGVAPPAVADAYAGLGVVLVREGNSKYARKFFEKALEADPTPDTRRLVQDELKKLRLGD